MVNFTATMPRVGTAYVSMLDWHSPLASVHLVRLGDAQDVRFRIDFGKRISLDRFDGEAECFDELYGMLVDRVRSVRLCLLTGEALPPFASSTDA